MALRILSFLFLIVCTMKSMGQDTRGDVFFSWSQAKAVPDSDGFAGSYAGVSNGALLIAGGANFPGGGRPWSGGVKMWHDRIFVLATPHREWKEAGRLPRAMGYGVSLTYGDGVVCLGGGDAERNYADAFILRYTGGRVEIVPLPAIWQLTLPSALITLMLEPAVQLPLTRCCTCALLICVEPILPASTP